MLGAFVLLFSYSANIVTDWTTVYVATIAIVTIKLLLIFATDELFSLQHLIK